MTADFTADVVVVGGGTSGCIAAARLAEEFGLRVVLVERGPLEPSRAPVDPFPDIAAGIGVETVDVDHGDGALRPRVLTAARLGGGGAVNGLIAEPCLPEDFDRWHDVHGCPGWSWADVKADADAVGQRRPTVMAPKGPVGEALSSAVPAARQATTSLTVDGAGVVRRAAGLEFVPAFGMNEPPTTLGATALRLGADGDGVAVVTDAGTIRARASVLCAGAVRTPGLLATVGVSSPRLGEGLMNHFGVMLPIDCGAGGAGHGTPPVSAVIDVIDDSGVRVGQLIAFEHIDATHRWAGLAAVLLRPVTRGSVTTTPGPVTMTMEIARSDVRRLGVVVRAALDALWALESRGNGLPGRVALGDGRNLGTLRAMTDDTLHEWVLRNVWHLSHAVGTCAMGDPESGSIVDHRGRVRGQGSLWVADASVMPEIVAVHPNTTVAVVAHRIAGFAGESLR